MSNLAIVEKESPVQQPDWPAIERGTASFAEMTELLKTSWRAVYGRAIERREWMTADYPSQKHPGKSEARILISQLPAHLKRRLMRMRRRIERTAHGLHNKGGIVVRDGRDANESLDGRMALNAQERDAVKGIYLSPKYGRPDAAGVFDHLKSECIRCHASELKLTDPRFAGRYKQWKCANPECDFKVSYWTIYRILSDELLPAAKTLARDGINAFANQYGRYIKRDWAGFHPNEEVFGDNHPCDIFVWNPREPYLRGGGAKLYRPQLSAWQDIGTCCVGYRIAERANADLLALAMRAYIKRWRKPLGIVTDNGSDYRSKQFIQFCQDLHIDVRNTLPSKRGGESHAKSKPIERFFGTYARDFDKQQPGWCGAKPEERPADYFLLLKKHDEFLAGTRDTSPFLSIDRYIEKASNWVEQSFHKLPSRRLDRAPNDIYAAYSGHLDTVPDRDMDVLMMAPVERFVGRRGAVIDHRDYWSREMIGLEGLPCTVRCDPGDMATAIVVVAYKDLPPSVENVPGKDRIIIAYHDALLGKDATKEDIQEAHRRKTAQRRFYREYQAAMIDAAAGIDTIDQVLAEKAECEQVPMAANGTNGVSLIVPGAQIRQAIAAEARGMQRTPIPRFASDIARQVLEMEGE